MTLRLAALICTLPFLLGAEVYRYVDENGVVTYTELLPYGVRGERVLAASTGPSQTVRDVDGSTVTATSGAPAGAVPANEAVNLSKDQQAMLEQLRQVEEARRTELAKIREANCAKSRDVLSRLSAQGRIRIKEESGEERAMPEDERQRRIREAQDGIVANCEPTG
jgi:hypothetical protein